MGLCQLSLVVGLLCIEILAPADRLGPLLRRLDDFVHMGVENLWILGLVEQSAFTCDQAGMKLVEGERLTIPDSPIYLDVPSMYAALDRLSADPFRN